MMDTQPRLVLGRYRLLDEIAVGGTARVVRARDEQLGRDVAVKLLHPHLLPDETSRRRLEAEARAAAGLAHPGIAAVYDVDADPAAPALVMELVEGESLAARLAREGRLQPAEVARLGAEVADALFLAHRRGIVHRDVKPGNILLQRESGRAKLIDFGIAHNLAPGSASLTQTGTALGTPRYMSPEQMAGEPAGPRTDLWSLGAVLYEAVSGRVPFDGSTPLAIARQQRDGVPPLPDGVDAGLAAIIGACLSYPVDQRPVHAGAVAEALGTWRPGGLDATTVTQLAVPPPVPPPAPADRAPVPVARSRSTRSRRVPLLAGLAAAAMVLLLAVALVTGSLRPTAETLPSASPTADPTPEWIESLLAAHLEACGEPLEEADLASMAREEAEAWVGELVADCLDAEDDDEGEGGGNENGGGNGRGNGNDDGNGNGNGNGRGNGGD